MKYLIRSGCSVGISDVVIHPDVKKMNEEIYYVSEKKDVQKKILNDLENRLIENKL